MIREIIQKLKRYKNTVAYWRRMGAKIGEECEIYPSTSFGSEPYMIMIGSHVRINDGVQLITHDGGVWVLRKYLNTESHDKIDLFGQIVIGNNVHIGTNAIIMPGVTIGDNCIIGCGAIVTKDIPNNTVAVGVPARVIESIDEYYNKHKSEFDYTKQLDSKQKEEYLKRKFKI